MKTAEIHRAINELSFEEVKGLLLNIMFTTELVQEGSYPKENVYEDLLEIHNLIAVRNKQQQWEPDENSKHVHIVFGDSFAGSMKLAIKRLGWEHTNKVIVFRDRYSLGPLWQLHEEQGRMLRQEWFRDHINDGDDQEDFERIYQSVIRQIALIPVQAKITIWSSMNTYEQVGLRHAVYLLRNNSNEIFMINPADACGRLFNRPDIVIEYSHSGEIPINKLQAVLNEGPESTPLNDDCRAILEQEWLDLVCQHEVLRIVRDGTILNVSQDYFDAYLMGTVEKIHIEKGNREFIRAARVIGEAIGHCDQYVRDDYFEYRLRELIYSGRLEIKGVPRAMRYYSVRSCEGVFES